MIALVALGLAGEPVELTVNGDLKSFFTAVLPYEHLLMPDAPTGQGVFDARLKLELRHGDRFRATFHQTATALTGARTPLAAGPSTGVGLKADELVPLSWTAFDEDLTIQGRVDRAVIAWTPDGFALTVGRQPISFGNGAFFTPLDLVNPFTPAVIDTEYKPGVDAVRLDLYRGTATSLTLATAWAGGWNARGLIVAAYGRTNVGVTDLGLFLGGVRGDLVAGTSLATGIGAVGLSGDLAVTLPADDRDPFVRATVGSLFRPTSKTTVMAELYVQTLGSTRPETHLRTTVDPRFQRSEIWLMGVGYAALSVAQELRPTLTGAVAVIGNVLDPSAFLAPSLTWSAADDVSFAAGGFVGLGARPDPLAPTDLIGPLGPVPVDQLDYLNSEFGAYPAVVWVQVRLYL